jgi:hypothetical protein
MTPKTNYSSTFHVILSMNFCAKPCKPVIKNIRNSVSYLFCVLLVT